MASQIRQCENKNKFCFVCAHFVYKNHSQLMTDNLLDIYKRCFGVNYRPNLWYIPQMVCNTCRMFLTHWNADNSFFVKYTSPALWLPRETHEDRTCYFCRSYKKKNFYRYEIRLNIDPVASEDVVRPELLTAEYAASQPEFYAVHKNRIDLAKATIAAANRGEAYDDAPEPGPSNFEAG